MLASSLDKYISSFQWFCVVLIGERLCGKCGFLLATDGPRWTLNDIYIYITVCVGVIGVLVRRNVPVANPTHYTRQESCYWQAQCWLVITKRLISGRHGESPQEERRGDTKQKTSPGPLIAKIFFLIGYVSLYISSLRLRSTFSFVFLSRMFCRVVGLICFVGGEVKKHGQ